MKKKQDKKKHHFVPISYLKFFCDAEGKVFVYRKDDPERVIHQKPENTGFHKYYYSQPLPKGGMDHNALEDAFGEVERKWPEIVRRLQQRENVNECLEDIFGFILLQRVRVPATRDAIENTLGAQVKYNMRQLDAVGKLPSRPEGFEDILDDLEVAIHPYKSAEMMPEAVRKMGERLGNEVGLNVFHNETETPFLTSDNPVIYFDPSIPEERMCPYALRPGGPIMLLFPVTPNLMIFGASFLRDRFVSIGIEHVDLVNRQFVKQCNREICRYAYETVFAQKRGQEALIQKYAAVSPVVETSERPNKDGNILFGQLIFGKRKRKPAWSDQGRQERGRDLAESVDEGGLEGHRCTLES